jgi:hypothetical protein
MLYYEHKGSSCEVNCWANIEWEIERNKCALLIAYQRLEIKRSNRPIVEAHPAYGVWDFLEMLQLIHPAFHYRIMHRSRWWWRDEELTAGTKVPHSVVTKKAISKGNCRGQFVWPGGFKRVSTQHMAMADAHGRSKSQLKNTHSWRVHAVAEDGKKLRSGKI